MLFFVAEAAVARCLATWGIMLGMWSLVSTRIFPWNWFEAKLKDIPAAVAGTVSEALARSASEAGGSEEETTILRTVGWVSAGLGALALGLFVGRELRQRYKFNRRTPYDFYAHSGDELQDVEFGVGV